MVSDEIGKNILLKVLSDGVQFFYPMYPSYTLLMIEFAEPLQRYLAERPPGAWVRDLSFVTSGWESDVYAFQLVRPSGETMPLILRLFPGDGAEQKVAREANGLTWLRLAGYPAPAIFWFEPDP